MNKIAGMEYLKPIYGAYLPGSDLLEIIEANGCACWLIILVTKATGKGDHSFNLDIYCLKEYLDPEELREMIEEILVREDLILVDCNDIICNQNLRSPLMDRDVVLW
ncbi:MAG: hypothetical protein ACD_7C00533G0002 [uncultured bacterium]|nr:MAG: hypothetical protein ACD_7C00533G0002 [uncultured bacterium]